MNSNKKVDFYLMIIFYFFTFILGNNDRSRTNLQASFLTSPRKIGRFFKVVMMSLLCWLLSEVLLAKNRLDLFSRQKRSS